MRLEFTSAIISLMLLMSACAQLKESADSDNNDDPSSAVVLATFPVTTSQSIDEPDDEDFYKVEIASAKLITITLSIPSGKDYDLSLLNDAESAVESSTNGAGLTESINFTSSLPGTYFIRIASGDGSFTAANKYRLTVQVSDTGGLPGFSNPHLTLGNPSEAKAFPDSSKNYLMEKSQFALSYNSSAGRPNWVSWQLNSAWVGNVARQEDFRSDESLPEAWYFVEANDFDNSGYDRGHMCPSGDRTATEADNSETFLMTNMIAQAPDNNQGPWADLENYCRGLVAEGDELFIIAGGYGSSGFIAAGHVSVPARIWKIIVVLNEPAGGLAGVNSATRVIAVDMPNVNGIRNANWKNYRVSVDQLEAATGYDFMSNVPASIQSVIESAVDNQ